MRSLEQMRAAVVADSRRRTYAMFGRFHHYPGQMTGRQARSHRGRSRRPDEIDHGGLVGVRREADCGGAGGGKRLGDLAGKTKVHGGERALETAHARGAIEIGLRAAAGKMQHSVERTLRQRRRNVGREALDLDGAIRHRRQQRHAARGKIAGAILAGEVKQRRGTLTVARAYERDEIVLVAVGGFNRAEACGPRRLRGVAADGEYAQRDERFAPRMAGDGVRSVRARDHHRAQRRAREFEIDGLDAQERRERDVVAARAQAGGGALAVSLRPCHQETHAVTPSPHTGAKKSAPARCLSSRPASAPRRTASAAAPCRFVSRTPLPSGLAIKPRKRNRPAATTAWPAIGVRQEPSSTVRKARSAVSAAAVSAWLTAASSASVRSS